MTDDRMVLIGLIEKSADTDLVREMLSFAAERLMEAEVEARTARRTVPATLHGRCSATAIASGFGTRAPAGLSLRSPSCAKAVTFPLSWSRGARPPWVRKWPPEKDQNFGGQRKTAVPRYGQRYKDRIVARLLPP